MAHLRGEIAGVMGVLSGLDVNDLFPSLPVGGFGVRAYDADGEDLLWVHSSIETAAPVGNRQPYEWLSRSVVQEDTTEFRRSRADRRTHQIEIALRDLLEFHGVGHAGVAYLDSVWDAKLVKSLCKSARSEGADGSDPRVLLDYTFLPQLGNAIVERESWFADGRLPDVDEFQRLMHILNGVRRKVAHHRAVTADDVRVCDSAADAILRRIGLTHPSIGEDFLAARWDERVAEIIDDAQAEIQSPAIPQPGSVPEDDRRRLAITGLETQLTAIERARERLAGVHVPPQRSQLHQLARSALDRWGDALERLLGIARRPDVTVTEAEAAAARYEAVLADVRELSRRIVAIRMGPSLGPTEADA